MSFDVSLGRTADDIAINPMCNKLLSKNNLIFITV